jgi:endonuclease/exonuclease/phosphatase (EEP) superfamily protein YafD
VSERASDATRARGSPLFSALLLRFERFVLATTHLKAGAGAQNEAMRVAQARQLVAAIAAFEPTSLTTLPVVLAGDLNDVPGAPLFAELQHACGGDAYTLAGVPLAFTTWKRRAEGVKKCVEDYIAISGGDAGRAITVASVWSPLVESEIEATLMPSLEHGSDHVLLAARLAFL